MNVNELFDVHVAKSQSFSKYLNGATAFVSNGFTNSGVQGYVTPKDGDKVFNKRCICISAFCEATVQEPPFVGRGNGGSGMIVLEPKREINKESLLFYAAFINRCVKWRFSFGRMVSKSRIPKIILPSLDEICISKQPEYLPKRNTTNVAAVDLVWEKFAIADLFDIFAGDFHNANSLPVGNVPLVSCGEKNDGVLKFVDVPRENIYRDTLTIAFNGSWPLTTKYRPYEFAAKDDVAVCYNRNRFGVEVLLFIKMMIEREVWRYSYGRKCFKEKLSGVTIQLPVTSARIIDENSIKNIFANTSYWNYLNHSIKIGIRVSHDIT